MRTDPKEPRHPISVAAERTGLSQDVLRVWERRYAAVVPSRGPGGQRLYSDADIERLRLMHATSRPGRSIAHIATMSTEALAEIMAEDAANVRDGTTSRAPDTLGDAFAHVKELDAVGLSRELRRAATSLGLHGFVESVAAPLMRRIGEDWRTGAVTIAEEHLAATVLRDLLVDVMRGFVNADGPRMVVATPAGERHEIGAAMAGAFAAAAGWNVIYLGADLPAGDIAAAARSSGATVVALSVVFGEPRDPLLQELKKIRAQLAPGVSVVVGGAGARDIAPALREAGVVAKDDLSSFTLG